MSLLHHLIFDNFDLLKIIKQEKKCCTKIDLKTACKKTGFDLTGRDS